MCRESGDPVVACVYALLFSSYLTFVAMRDADETPVSSAKVRWNGTDTWPTGTAERLRMRVRCVACTGVIILF